MIHSGRLNKLITIQQSTQTRDAHGGNVDSWGTYAVRMASIVPMNGREYFTARQEASEVSHRVRIRYDSTAGATTPKMRILYGSRVFDIESVINPKEANKEIVMMCRELNNG